MIETDFSKSDKCGKTNMEITVGKDTILDAVHIWVYQYRKKPHAEDWYVHWILKTEVSVFSKAKTLFKNSIQQSWEEIIHNQNQNKKGNKPKQGRLCTDFHPPDNSCKGLLLLSMSVRGRWERRLLQKIENYYFQQTCKKKHILQWWHNHILKKMQRHWIQNMDMPILRDKR